MLAIIGQVCQYTWTVNNGVYLEMHGQCHKKGGGIKAGRIGHPELTGIMSLFGWLVWLR